MSKFIKLKRKILDNQIQNVLLQVDRIILCVSMPNGTFIKYDDNLKNSGMIDKVPEDTFESYYEESIEEIYKMINE